MDPLAKLFGSFARLKLLRLFLFNDDTSFSLSEVNARTKTAKEAVRKELTALTAMQVLKKKTAKKGTVYEANRKFQHYSALQAFIRSTTGLSDANIVDPLKRAGALRLVVLSGLFTGAQEIKLDLLVVGDKLEDRVLDQAVRSLEAELGRELTFAAFTTEDFKYRRGVYDRLLRDVFDFPHRVLLDRIGLR